MGSALATKPEEKKSGADLRSRSVGTRAGGVSGASAGMPLFLKGGVGATGVKGQPSVDQAVVTPSPGTATTYGYTQDYSNPPGTKNARAKSPSDLKKYLRDLEVQSGAKTGVFFEVELNISIPTELPGLSIGIEIEGNYTRFAGGKQELELGLNVGGELSFLDIFTAKLGAYGSMKLQGESLFDAFIDAVNQLTLRLLLETGVDETLRKIDRHLHPTARDVLLLSLINPAFLVFSWTTGEIGEALEVYFAFVRDNLKDNRNVGFELEAGVSGSVKISDDAAKELGLKAGVERKEGIGLVDEIGSSAPKVFTQSFVKANVNEMEVSLSRREVDDSRQDRLKLSGAIPFKASSIDAAVSPAKALMKNIVGASGFVDAFRNSDPKRLGDMAFAATKIGISDVKHKFGFEIEIEKETEIGKAGQFSWKVSMRLKDMQSFEPEEGETKLKWGNFIDIDISSEIQSELKQKDAQAIGTGLFGLPVGPPQWSPKKN